MASNNSSSNGFGIAVGLIVFLAALGAWNSGALDWLLGSGEGTGSIEAEEPSFSLPDFLVPDPGDDETSEEDAPASDAEADKDDGSKDDTATDDGSSQQNANTDQDAAPVSDPTIDVAATKAALDTLDIKGRAPKTGYDRDDFPHWNDPDGNSCDARNDILARDLTSITVDTDDCTVLTGVLDDPYTGETINFERGQTTSSAVQIEHVVALSDAWQKGAQAWDADTREQFANDPDGLIAVDGPANMAKGDSDAATWLPPNKAYRCEYVATQVEVKVTYELWVTAAEHDAINRVLDAC